MEGAAFERIGHLRPLPLPGGDRAAEEPWRMAAAVLHELGRNDEIVLRCADEPGAATVASMLQRNFNCPRSSSLGRVFDAAAGLLGLCHRMKFDAQGAIALEQAATRYVGMQGMPQELVGGWKIGPSFPRKQAKRSFELAAKREPSVLIELDSRFRGNDEVESDGADFQLDMLPLLSILANMQEAEYGAALLHSTLIAALSDWAQQASQRSGIKTLTCGGGCFFNKLLAAGLPERMAQAGIECLFPKTLLPGDTAISLGQAWIAARRIA